MLWAVGAISLSRHRTKQADAGRADGGRQMERTGVARDHHPRPAEEFTEILEGRVGGHHGRPLGFGHDPFRGGPLDAASPDDEGAKPVSFMELPGDGGKPLGRPELARPAGPRVDHDGLLGEAKALQPAADAFPAHRPTGHGELRPDFSHPQRHEQITVAVDDMSSRRPDAVGVGKPGPLAGEGTGESDPHSSG